MGPIWRNRTNRGRPFVAKIGLKTVTDPVVVVLLLVFGSHLATHTTDPLFHNIEVDSG